jgi:hypothetical protein
MLSDFWPLAHNHFMRDRFPFHNNRRPIVRNFFFQSFIAAIAISFAVIASPGYAQTLASRTWVSGTGDDGNACSRTAPCKTFASAISKTSIHGEINCLDPGGFGAFEITKSITIDCHDAVGAIANAATDGVEIDFDAFDPSDTFKQINLRNLTIQGVGTGVAGINIGGAGQGSLVSIEGCVVDGNDANVAVGIRDLRIRGALVIDQTIVRNNSGTGISIASSGNGSRRAVISNTRVVNSAVGIDVGAFADVMIEHSLVTNNATAGLMVESTGVVMVDSTTISHNGNGIQNSGSVRLSNNNFFLNTVAISGSASSFTNNRFSNNATIGTIIPIGTAANPTGQQ